MAMADLAKAVFALNPLTVDSDRCGRKTNQNCRPSIVRINLDRKIRKQKPPLCPRLRQSIAFSRCFARGGANTNSHKIVIYAVKLSICCDNDSVTQRMHGPRNCLLSNYVRYATVT